MTRRSPDHSFLYYASDYYHAGSNVKYPSLVQERYPSLRFGVIQKDSFEIYRYEDY
jgi:hypothetical protein